MADKPKTAPDFTHWSKKSYWTLDEGVALSLGREPTQTKWEQMRMFTQVDEFAGKYSKIRDLAERAQTMGHMSNPVAPGAYIAWLDENEIKYPSELGDQVAARGYKDWRQLHQELKVLMDGEIEILNAEIREKDAQILKVIDKKNAEIFSIIDEKNLEILNLAKDKFTEAAQTTKLRDLLSAIEEEQKAKPRSPAAEAKETDSLLKMIVGMAVEQYGYIPDQNRSRATGDIETDLRTYGVPLDRNTILKHLYSLRQRLMVHKT
jgi:hypothetical protein